MELTWRPGDEGMGVGGAGRVKKSLGQPDKFDFE